MTEISVVPGSLPRNGHLDSIDRFGGTRHFDDWATFDGKDFHYPGRDQTAPMKWIAEEMSSFDSVVYKGRRFPVSENGTPVYDPSSNELIVFSRLIRRGAFVERDLSSPG